MKEDIWRRIPSENAHSSMQCPPSPAFQLRSMTKHIFISSHQRWDVLLKPGELFWDSPMESPKKEINDGIRTVSVTHQVCCITNEVGKRAVLLWNYSFLLKDEPHTHTHTHCIIKLTNTEYHLVYYSLIIAERKLRVVQPSYCVSTEEKAGRTQAGFCIRKRQNSFVWVWDYVCAEY